jgi:protein-S-isoprenylcysteine O-methyltransferase Ste14
MLLRQLASIVALSVTVIIILPIFLVSLTSYVPFWGFPYHSAMLLLIVGIALMGIGFILLYSTISLFIKKGKGTIAPWDPTKKLIVTSFYSHVCNPMYEGVFLFLTGESIIVGSVPLILWTLLVIIGNLLYVPLKEEQKLAERFGDEYLIYKKNVPRWIPCLTSWKQHLQTLDQSNLSQMTSAKTKIRKALVGKILVRFGHNSENSLRA